MSKFITKVVLAYGQRLWLVKNNQGFTLSMEEKKAYHFDEEESALQAGRDLMPTETLKERVRAVSV